MRNQQVIAALVGVIGGIFTTLFGGWSAGMTTLIIFMSIDYIAGLTVAAVFKKSEKSESGALESRAGWRGLAKKAMTLLFVLIAYRLDLLMNTDYIRDAAVIAFCVNELISIVENAGLMGIPLPNAIIRALDVLKEKADFVEDDAHGKTGD